MANNKQPLDLMLLKGNKHLTKKEIEERRNSEVKTDVNDVLIAPSTLNSKKLKDRFYYLAEQLLISKIISNLDVSSLARYVTLEEQYNKITKILSKTDILATEYDSLLLKQTKVFGMLDKLSNSLCLNIISRCKVSVPKPEEKKKNKFDQFQGAKNG